MKGWWINENSLHITLTKDIQGMDPMDFQCSLPIKVIYVNNMYSDYWQQHRDWLTDLSMAN